MIALGCLDLAELQLLEAGPLPVYAVGIQERSAYRMSMCHKDARELQALIFSNLNGPLRNLTSDSEGLRMTQRASGRRDPSDRSD